VQVGDLVQYRDPKDRGPNDTDMTNGIVVGFDSEDDPIVYFTCRKNASAFYEDDIEVLNESG